MVLYYYPWILLLLRCIMRLSNWSSYVHSLSGSLYKDLGVKGIQDFSKHFNTTVLGFVSSFPYICLFLNSLYLLLFLLFSDCGLWSYSFEFFRFRKIVVLDDPFLVTWVLLICIQKDTLRGRLRMRQIISPEHLIDSIKIVLHQWVRRSCFILHVD